MLGRDYASSLNPSRVIVYVGEGLRVIAEPFQNFSLCWGGTMRHRWTLPEFLDCVKDESKHHCWTLVDIGSRLIPNPTQVLVDIGSRLMPNPKMCMVPSAPVDLASDFLGGSNDHISDQSFLYSLSREGPSYHGLSTICWKVCLLSSRSY